MPTKTAYPTVDRRAARDPKTELFLWQRTLFFRPWYRDAKVIELGCRDGKYLKYIGAFASEAIGLEDQTCWVEAANRHSSKVDFRFSDFVNERLDAEVVLGFEALEELAHPDRLLEWLSEQDMASLLLSATNLAARNHSDLTPNQNPLWTATEFRQKVEKAFSGRKVEFLHQRDEWPARLEQGFDEEALYTIAVIGERPLPSWPGLGIAMPTISAERVRSAVLGFSRFYPGKVQFAVVANAPTSENLTALRGLQDDLPELIHLIESDENLGFGMGANLGLDWLRQEGWFDLFGVTNDDVMPAIDCLPQIVSAFDDLREAGEKPGVIGPVTNQIHGAQQVDIGKYTNFDEMIELSNKWNAEHHSCGTPTDRVRGLLMLIDPSCLSDVGGFDPIFGLGNWEDDDHNLRCRLAGYSLWIADGAFLHHQGSATFKEIGLKYEANIHRNLELICEKWGVSRIEDFFAIAGQELAKPAEPSWPLFVSLSAAPQFSGHRVRIEKEVVDLVYQATDMEFCAFVYEAIKHRPREERLAILESMQAAA